MLPLLLPEIIAGLGFGEQVVAAVVAMVLVSWAYRSLKLGKMIGGVVGQAMLYVLAVGVFIAVGSIFGWVDAFALVGDMGAFVGGVITWVIETVGGAIPG